MTDEKKGLPRPKQAPVDLFTLQPDKDLLPAFAETEEVGLSPMEPPEIEVEPEPDEQQDQDVEEPKDEAALERPKRLKTSVELTPSTLDLISQIKVQYRREHRRHLPMWRILDEAIRMYAEQRFENTEIGNPVIR